MDEQLASAIARENFGISGQITKLAGERNPNFLLTSDSERFILKIHGADEVPK